MILGLYNILFSNLKDYKEIISFGGPYKLIFIRSSILQASLIS